MECYRMTASWWKLVGASECPMEVVEDYEYSPVRPTFSGFVHP